MNTDIERFLNNEMNEEERLLFLEKVNSDNELKETIALYKEMQPIYNDRDWKLERGSKNHPKVTDSVAFLNSEKGKNIKKVISEEANLYFNKQTKTTKIRKLFITTGAIAAIFIIGFFLMNTNETNTDLYTAYKNDWSEIPSLTVRGTNNDFSAIETLFRQKKYSESLLLLEKLKKNETTISDPQILLYEGILNLELNKYEKAIFTFKSLLKKDTLDSYKTYWYLALTYLKKGDIKETKKALQMVLNDTKNFKDKEAEALLSILK